MNEIAATAVYVLCAITSAACALLLWRAFGRSRHQLLVWTSVFFGGMAIQSAVVVLDLVIFPDIDMSLLRGLIGVSSFCVLLFGLIWEDPA